MELPVGKPLKWVVDITDADEILVIEPSYYDKEWLSTEIDENVRSMVGGYFWFEHGGTSTTFSWKKYLGHLNACGSLRLDPGEGVVAVEVRAWPASVDTQRKTQSQRLAMLRNLPDNSFTPFQPDAPIPTWEYVVYLNTDKQYVIKPRSDGKSDVRERRDDYLFPGHTRSGKSTDGAGSFQRRIQAHIEGDDPRRPAGAPSKGGYFVRIPQSPTVEPGPMPQRPCPVDPRKPPLARTAYPAHKQTEQTLSHTDPKRRYEPTGHKWRAETSQPVTEWAGSGHGWKWQGVPHVWCDYGADKGWNGSGSSGGCWKGWSGSGWSGFPVEKTHVWYGRA